MLDHLVYLVADLNVALGEFAAIGLSVSPGGTHPDRGTHNALLRLGNDSYLELLAVDPGTPIPPPRWMGIDEGGLPRISRWALHAGADIVGKAKFLRHLPEVQVGKRTLSSGDVLRWQLTDPGVSPAVATLPFMIAWPPQGPHPADNLPDTGLSLQLLELTDPQPQKLLVTLDLLGYHGPLELVMGSPEIRVKLNGPQGDFWLPPTPRDGGR